MTAKLDARDADALFAAVVLQPVVEAVLTPLLLRSGAGGKQAGPREKAWAQLDELYSDLGLDGGESLAQLRPGPGWRQLDADEQDRVRSPSLTPSLSKSESAPSSGSVHDNCASSSTPSTRRPSPERRCRWHEAS